LVSQLPTSAQLPVSLTCNQFSLNPTLDVKNPGFLFGRKYAHYESLVPHSF
jgi:hypothetical protein